jgi:hypothetical protein
MILGSASPVRLTRGAQLSAVFLLGSLQAYERQERAAENPGILFVGHFPSTRALRAAIRLAWNSGWTVRAIASAFW